MKPPYKVLHDKAMEFVDESKLAKMEGNDSAAKSFLQKAFFLEKESYMQQSNNLTIKQFCSTTYFTPKTSFISSSNFFGTVVGPYRLKGSPSGVIKNLVKFHLIFLPIKPLSLFFKYL